MSYFNLEELNNKKLKILLLVHVREIDIILTKQCIIEFHVSFPTKMYLN